MYLYIYENGVLQQVNHQPTPDDLKAVDDGTLTIIGLSTNGNYFQECDGAGDFTTIPVVD